MRLAVETLNDQELHLDLTLYYCQDEDARLCLIHDRRLVLPIFVTPGSPASTRIRYSIEASGPFAQPSA